MSDDRTAARGKVWLSQEMVAIIIFGSTLATLQLYLVWDIREEGRAWRAVRAEKTAAWETENDQMRDEARTKRERSQREILCPPEADPA